MRGAVFHAHHDIRVEDIPVPQPGPNQALIGIEWCGICGSDLHEYLIGPVVLPTKERPHPRFPLNHPVPLGHEFVGRIRTAPSGSKFKEGDAVVVDPRMLCKSCVNCKSGATHCCKTFGYIGGTTPFGGYSEQVAVDEDMLLAMPKEIPMEYAAVLEPLAVVWHGIKQTGITDWANKNVLVLGGGPIGIAMSLCLKAQGTKQIIVSEPTPTRRTQVSEFASVVLNPIEDNIGQKCQNLTDGEGVDVVFDCAGVPAALDAGFAAIRYEGVYMMVAVWEKPMVVPNWLFLTKHITMKGTLIMGTNDFAEVMDMMVSGKLAGYEKMVTGRISVEDIVSKGFEELANNRDKHIKILVDPRRKR
jgi:2-desacetyl-2-hydroxyethyl bacteriochlorophyllide A dehydrogenase